MSGIVRHDHRRPALETRMDDLVLVRRRSVRVRLAVGHDVELPAEHLLVERHRRLAVSVEHEVWSDLPRHGSLLSVWYFAMRDAHCALRYGMPDYGREASRGPAHRTPRRAHGEGC